MGPKQFHELVVAFPHTEYATSCGQPACKTFGQFLTRLRHEDDSVAPAQAPVEEREIICEADPETFHFTDHYRNYPYVLARLKRLDAKTLRGYLMRRWRHNAPAKWLEAYDAGSELPELKVTAPRKRSRKTKR